MKWDSDQFRAERDRKMLAWMCGNEDAVRVVVQTSHIAEVWDDLKDGDRKPSDREIAHAFESAMIHLQTNRFYMHNHAMLMGVIVLVANAWHDANQWGECDDWRAHQAFYLRNMGIELAILCAFICGGYDHMRAVSTGIREFFHHETFEEWRHAA